MELGTLVAIRQNSLCGYKAITPRETFPRYSYSITLRVLRDAVPLGLVANITEVSNNGLKIIVCTTHISSFSITC